MQVVARIAKDPSIDIDKFAKVIELQKDLMQTQAKIDFEVAFNQMEPELPVIVKRGRIKGKNRPTIPFAKLDDIQKIVKPILHRHGFTIRHRTEWPANKAATVRIVGVLTHISGHSEESSFEGPADTSEYRSHIQSLGSTISYGRRYTTIDVLDLTIEGQDNDGKDGPEPARPEAPRTYQDPQPPPARPAPGRDRPVITDRQVERLWRLVHNAGRSEPEVMRWLQVRFGYTQPEQITRADYDFICQCIEAPNALPEGSRG